MSVTLTQARLKQLLSYDPETGSWMRLVNRSRRAQAGSSPTSKDPKGYIFFMVDGKSYRSCRLAFLYMTGEWPPAQVDHVDLDKSNDRWKNLRAATSSQNMANRRVFARNSLGIKGVWNDGRKSRPFRSRIQVDGKTLNLGSFESAEEASAAYAEAAKKYFGDFARVS